MGGSLYIGNHYGNQKRSHTRKHNTNHIRSHTKNPTKDRVNNLSRLICRLAPGILTGFIHVYHYLVVRVRCSDNVLHVFEMSTRALIVAYWFRNGFNTFKRFNVFCFSFNVFENDKGVPNCFTCSYGFNNFIMIVIVCQVFVVFRMLFLTIEMTVFIILIVVVLSK